jgi:hypothetical protein
VKKAGKDKARRFWKPKPTYAQEREIPMAHTTAQKIDNTMKHIIFIILGALTVMCLALGTGYLQP